ncbi:hypothetical protein Acr_24g0006440 [Actinidia rufa]|uniref:Uncharacterized protein n=1 Tax=Actinidia rufa TaxID=165716 RepID=A0A7J0GVA3_9ERIC|nr:hypothetical protein Acr_24g0006440 [Actinidia rufa]
MKLELKLGLATLSLFSLSLSSSAQTTNTLRRVPLRSELRPPDPVAIILLPERQQNRGLLNAPQPLQHHSLKSPKRDLSLPALRPPNLEIKSPLQKSKEEWWWLDDEELAGARSLCL